jgi:hypothetical protein
MGWKSQQSLHPHLDVPGLAVAVVATMLRVSALRGMHSGGSRIFQWGGHDILDLGLPTKVRQQVPRRGYGGQQPPVGSDFCYL